MAENRHKYPILDVYSAEYPAIVVDVNRVHLFKTEGGEWEVWLNTEASDFDGLCISLEQSRDTAIDAAVDVLRKCIEALTKARSSDDGQRE